MRRIIVKRDDIQLSKEYVPFEVSVRGIQKCVISDIKSDVQSVVSKGYMQSVRIKMICAVKGIKRK